LERQIVWFFFVGLVWCRRKRIIWIRHVGLRVLCKLLPATILLLRLGRLLRLSLWWISAIIGRLPVALLRLLSLPWFDPPTLYRVKISRFSFRVYPFASTQVDAHFYRLSYLEIV